jgi:tetratricopeptide (TPR) repeat protein
VTALFLESEKTADLLALVSRLGLDAWPSIYRVPGGYLLKIPTVVKSTFAPALSLRAVSDNLFVPADAILEPALLPDEATALVQTRGILFLPGGRVLGFQLDKPLEVIAVLSAPQLAERTWQSLPDRPARAEQLREIVLDRPDEEVGQIIEAGRPGAATEEIHRASPGPGTSALGYASATVGTALVWLANLLRWERLAKFAAGMVGSALERVPSIRESLLGKQEAALRALLQEFRSGDLERALRRALPLRGNASRGSAPAQNAELPHNEPRFSLKWLLSQGQGPTVAWHGGGEVQPLLADEYRKAAAAAADRGDHRRAAFIYGHLLCDLRLAAAALQRGGMHHEAGVLYLEKVGDTLAAAKAFAAAGEMDRALKLYRERGEHGLAGDLLKESGDDESALAEYTIAAEILVTGNDYLEAGHMMQKRAGRHDLARAYFAAGWAKRPAGNAVPCLVRLADMLADQESPDDLLVLIGEADLFFAEFGGESAASQFYDQLARIADRPHLGYLRDDLRDRALMGVANRLRQRSTTENRPGTVVSSLLGKSGLWDPAVLSDAEYAFTATVRKHAGPVRRGVAETSRLRLVDERITVACSAQETGLLFVGTANGKVIAFDPATGALKRRSASKWPVAALSTGIRGNAIVSICLSPRNEAEICSYYRLSLARSPFTYASHTMRRFWSQSGCVLTPIRINESGPQLGMWDGKRFELLAGLDLVPVASFNLSGDDVRSFDPKSHPPPPPPLAFFDVKPDDARSFAAILCPPPRGEHLPAVLYQRGLNFFYQPFGKVPASVVETGWSPFLVGSSEQVGLQFSARLFEDARLDLACIHASKVVRYSILQFTGNSYEVRCSAWARSAQIKAFAILAPGRVAIASEKRVEWLRLSGDRFEETGQTSVSLPDVVACFDSPRTNELLVVCRGGELVRVPIPV